MFEVANCSQCNLPVTPENRDQFVQKNGQYLCPQCAAAASPAQNMMAVFDNLVRTTFVQKRPERKYARAGNIKDMIDIFETSLIMRRKKRAILMILIPLLLAAGAGAAYMFFLHKTAGTKVPPPDPGGTAAVKPPDGGTPTPPGPGPDVPANPEAEKELAQLRGEYSEHKDPFIIRAKVAAAAAKHAYPALDKFLEALDARIAETATMDLRILGDKIEDNMRGHDYSGAVARVAAYTGKYGKTEWYAGAGAKQVKTLNGTISEQWETHIQGLLQKARVLEEAENFKDAYQAYEHLLKIASAGHKPALEAKLEEITAASKKLYGEGGLEAHLKWQKYVVFRRQYLAHVNLRDFKQLRIMGAEYLKSAEYRLIKDDIQKDLGDIRLIEKVMANATASLSQYINKSHTINTQAGKLTGVIKSVAGGTVTIVTSGVEISIPISQLAVGELIAFAGDTAKDKAAFRLGLGILFLAEGSLGSAQKQFGAAKALGAKVERYLEHLRAARHKAKENEASQAFEKIGHLVARRQWDRTLDRVTVFRREFKHTAFYGTVTDQLTDWVNAARARRECRITLSRGFLPGPGFQGGADTMLNDSTSESRRRNYGAHQYLRASGDGKLVSLIRYDLSRIPRHGNVYSAVLSLYCKEIREPRGIPMLQLFRITEKWVEGTRKMALPETGATWFEPIKHDGSRTKAGNWAVYGGTADLETDWGFGPNGIVAQQPAQAGAFVDFDITAVAREWAAGRRPNYGLLIKAGTKARAGQNNIYLYSSDASADAAKRPRLALHYKGEGEYRFADLDLRAFDGFDGETRSLLVPDPEDPAGPSLATCLIRESTPERAERKTAWRGRTGAIEGSRHRVLLALKGLDRALPSGTRITDAALQLHICKAVSKKKMSDLISGT